ncbi:hypothetical protein HIM_08216 [Hirsutella minnesotensis 3608]|uniref:Succinyl-3-ketoacid-coenzyme a transferase n=1 Tax=Hirsutella minnesotensis 3608 TaxID=1043627 RepID=A0A0F7ZT33_9HYPO|nr:hypothetical protein HIM_08216 [Hirsutella minnesotensis 3608]
MFDVSTGQVFKEWTLPRHAISARGDDADWSRRRPYPLLTPRGSRGPRSLVDTAINVIANNIGDVADEYLDHIPLRLRWRIWRFLEARGVCLHAWTIFSKQLLSEDDEKTLGLYRFRQHIRQPGTELERYVQPLTSLSTDFITHIVISGGCEFGTHQLLCLAHMSNLGVLELVQPTDELRATFPTVEDRLLRGWTEMQDPFPLLRILRIWGDRSVTQESLRWVSKFPSLTLYDVVGSRDDWHSPYKQATEHGWDMAPAASGLDDSLSQYLMLFAPHDGISGDRLKDLARTVDSDLLSISSDSRCAVKFVADGDATSLLDYLSDTTKADMPTWNTAAASADSRSSTDVAFEFWAFWLYSLIGQLTQDADLRNRGVQSILQAVAGPFVLPSKPFATLFLGQSGRGGISNQPAYVSRGLFVTKCYTFTRSTTAGVGVATEVKATWRNRRETGSPKPGEPTVRRQKRQRLNDVLQSLSR